jgi:hypothetical protein
MDKKDLEILFLTEKISSLERKFDLFLNLHKKIVSDFEIKINLKDKEISELKLKVEKLTVKSNEPPGSKPDYLKSSSKPETWKSSGQKKGHKGTSRTSPEKIDKEKHYSASDTCPGCNSNDLKASKIRTKIISDLEFQIIHIKEFLHDKKCVNCGTKVKAISPHGASQSP